MDNYIQLGMFDRSGCKLTIDYPDMPELSDLMYAYELASAFNAIASLQNYSIVFYGNREDLSNIQRRILGAKRDINSV